MKSKKSIFALALCGIVAICASVIGATAAWFTDTVTINGSVGLAYLDINSSATINVTNAVPGDTIASSIQVTEGTNTVTTEFYLRVSVKSTVPGLTVGTPGTGWVAGASKSTGVTEFYYGTAATTLTKLDESKLPLTLWADGLKIGTDVTEQGGSGTITITIDAVQADNVAATETAFDNIKANVAA